MSGFDFSNTGTIRVIFTERKAHIAEELADVLIYAVQLARGLDIDVSEAMLRKIEIVKKRRDDPEYGRTHPHLD